MARRIDIPPAARPLLATALVGACLAACATPRYDSRAVASNAPPAKGGAGQKIGKPYQVKGVWYTPRAQPNYDETGIGSWYGEQFHNRHTANGEVFDMDRVSAAHTTLPLPSLVEVTNLDNGRTLVVRVNDRGPFVGGRIIDLSREAARQLGYERQGVARVRVRYLGSGSTDAMHASTQQAAAPARPQTPTQPAFAPPRPQAPAAPLRMAALDIAQAPAAVAGGPDYLPDIRPVRSAVAAAGGGYRIQAAAFSDLARAEQAAETLSQAGRAEIVPLERDGQVLYRVQVSGEGEAGSARDRVAALGYGDARVLTSE